jgi:putative membrane protein
LGIFLVIFGIITIVLAAWRYNQIFWQIEQGDYRPKRLPVLIMTGAVMVFGLLSIPLLLIRNQIPQRPFSPPKQNQSFHIR